MAGKLRSEEEECFKRGFSRKRRENREFQQDEMNDELLERGRERVATREES